MDRKDLEGRYHLNPPADEGDIAAAQEALGKILPESFVDLLRLSNGISCDGGLVLLEVEDIAQRNLDYELPEYLPDYIMIGDDSGGVAIVMKQGDQAIYEVDMGVMDEAEMEKSADSLSHLLIDLKGQTLMERS